MNNSQVAHRWANQIGTHGTGSHFYFERDRLYSYGAHFCVGRIVETKKRRRVALLTTRSYSTTTAKHKALAFQAVYGDYFCVPNLDDTVSAIAENYSRYLGQISENLALLKRARSQAEGIEERIIHLILAANDYADYFQAQDSEAAALKRKIRAYARKSSAGTLLNAKERAALDRRKAAAAEQAAHKAIRAAARRAARMEELRLLLDKWAEGADIPGRNFWELPARLRIKNSSVETSYGAVVSCRAALALYHAIKSGRAVEGAEIDGYTVDKWETQADGSTELKIGCHRIPRPEIERLGALLEARAAEIKTNDAGEGGAKE